MGQSRHPKTLHNCPQNGSFQDTQSVSWSISGRGDVMDTKFLPRELVSRCLNYVVAYHKQAGHSNLAQQLWDRETMVFLSLHKDMMEILGAAVTSFRMRRLLWLLALVVIALVVFINWWIALALMPVIFAERYFARRERENHICGSRL
jgi:hypothetical protein